MKLVVIGVNGLLGSNFVSVGHQCGLNVVGTYHSTEPNLEIPLTHLDIRDAQAFQKILEHHKPDAVVNCAAMTDVDGCEENPERAYAINGDAPGSLARCCVKHNVDFAHVSTDYVFDGTTASDYDEAANPNPVQVYGESKLEGERVVQEVTEKALITRLSFVYGIHWNTNELTGFPAWVRSRLKADKQTSLFTDQQVTPTRAGHAAETIIDLLDVNARGLYHVACRSCVSPYDFGVRLQNRLDIDANLLFEGSKDDVNRSANRPSDTCFSVSKVEKKLCRSQPTLKKDLDEIQMALF